MNGKEAGKESQSARCGFRPEALLDAVQPHLPKVLVPGEGFRALHGIAASLPPIALTLGLECRLAGNGPVDFGASVSPANGGAAVLAGRSGDETLARSARRDLRWRRLRAFAKSWTAKRSRLALRVPFVFLEFDADAPRKPVPVPSVFLGLDWLLEEIGAARGAPARRGLAEALAAAEKLRGKRFGARTKALAARCFEALPARGVLLHAAVMLARAGQDLRFSVLVPRAEVGGYLRDVERADCAPAVLEVVESYGAAGGFAHAGAHVQLDFDVGGGDERIGVTLNPRESGLWRKLLEKLLADGLADRAKAEGLLGWSGASVEALGDSLPPCVVVRWLWHVKVVCTPGGVTGAKVYFGMKPVWPQKASFAANA